MKYIVHYSLHFLFPGLIAFGFYRETWKKAWLIFVLTMAVDLDHLLADPIFDPNRCSVGFHYLHAYPVIAVYVLAFIFARHRTVRIVASGLILHMLTDYIDCLL